MNFIYNFTLINFLILHSYALITFNYTDYGWVFKLMFHFIYSLVMN